VFPLKYFFNDKFVTSDGDVHSTVAIRKALAEIIEKEDKKNPYPDEVLAEMLKEKGFPVARRTVAKYRMQLGLPVARLRKGQINILYRFPRLSRCFSNRFISR